MGCHSHFGPQTHTLERRFYSHTSTQVENFGKVCWNMFGCYTMEANICSVENFLYVAPKYVWGSWAWRPWISMWGLGSLCWLSTFGDGCMAMFFFLPVQVFLSLSSVCPISGWMSEKGVPLGCRKRVRVPWGCRERVFPNKKCAIVTRFALTFENGLWLSVEGGGGRGREGPSG